MRARGATRTLRLLSAGCASGEEPIRSPSWRRKPLLDPSWDVPIRAIDLNPAALEKARARALLVVGAARNAARSPAQMVPRRRPRDGPRRRRCAAPSQFEAGNLASDDPGAVAAGRLRRDLLPQRADVFRAGADARGDRADRANRWRRAAFCSSAMPRRCAAFRTQFHLRHTHETFYYQRKDGSVPSSLPSTAQVAAERVLPAVRCRSRRRVTAWVDTIRAGERARRGAGSCGESRPTAPEPALAAGLGSGASASISCATSASPKRSTMSAAGRRDADSDPDVLLLKAMLLAHSGQLAAAEEACLRLLLIDEFNAGAHYVLALCREHRATCERAAEHDRVAAYLDPAFAMPGCISACSRAAPATAIGARRELAQALVLLKREDAVAAAAVRRRLQPRGADRALRIGARGLRRPAMTDRVIRLTERAAELRLAFDRAFAAPLRVERRAKEDLLGDPRRRRTLRHPLVRDRRPVRRQEDHARSRRRMRRCSASPASAAPSCRSTTCACCSASRSAGAALACDRRGRAGRARLRSVRRPAARPSDAILPQHGRGNAQATPANSSARRDVVRTDRCICLPSSTPSRRTDRSTKCTPRRGVRSMFNNWTVGRRLIAGFGLVGIDAGPDRGRVLPQRLPA